MSGAPGRREVAHRVFASEFDDATHAFTRGDEERSPKYVVSPTGALMNRVFVVGVLTEVEAVNEETVRGRIADPTGVFVVYASQYQPDARATLQELSPPSFVAVTGKANTFVPDGADRTYTSVRPEAVAAVDAATRDHWAVTTAERTIERIGRMARVLVEDADGDDGIARARREYDPSPAYLAGLYSQCLEILEVVTGERDRVETEVSLDMDGDRAYALSDLVEAAEALGRAEPPEPIDEPAPVPEETSEEVDDERVAPPDEPVVTDDEREAIEDEFGTEFATGDEVESPDAAETASPGPDTGGADDDDGEDVTLADRLVELLEELDNGEGVPRSDLIETGADRFDASEDELEEAVREAMMDGHCYEPAEDLLRPI